MQQRNGLRKKNFRIALEAILFLLLLIPCLVSCAAAADAVPVLRISCPSRCAEVIISRSGEMGLKLAVPGSWDPDGMTLEMDGYDHLYLGNDRMEIRAGEPVSLREFLNQSVPVFNGNNGYAGQLTIWQGSDIPSLFLTVDGAMLKKIRSAKGSEITEGRAVYTEADGTVAYEGGISQLKCRGQNTFSYPKKPYQVKLETKASLSGMAKAKTWILLANWNDISLLRNQIVLEMSRAIGLRNALACVQADVWINGLYQGLYLVSEKIQIGKERIPVANLEKATEEVNAAPLDPGKIVTEKGGEFPLMRSYPALKDPEDITGGYIMTVEKYPRLRDYVIAGFRTAQELCIQIKEPTYPSKAQAEYLARRITETQEALIAKDGIHPETGKRFDEYLDATSFAQRFLVEDWCKNYDYVGGSQFLYKDSDRTDPLIYAGPSWDYDLSFGNMKDRGFSPRGRHVTLSQRTANLWWLLSRHESFMEEVKETWRNSFRRAAAVLLGEAEETRGGGLRSLDEYRAEIAASAAMNFARWGINSEASAQEAGGSFDRACDYLKNWIRERTAWMEERYGAAE